MKIYTKTGDAGMTGIYRNERVAKDSPRIEANGELDELDSCIGVVRSQLPASHEFQPILRDVQLALMEIMAQVATPSSEREAVKPLPENLVECCEKHIDELQERCDAMGLDCGCFILPGGTAVSAFCHLARSVARRAERRLWTLHKIDPLPEEALVFVNRLSDMLYSMARLEQCASGMDEERWRSFACKF
ncbi:MAG: cob(I)yrinic acid a,c-diamide adenosyltransferase [Marinifilaceae bacterium]|nr:cob(I)yrinic acid a,c-diamide adenosyltransferase [Marinifilaceae bacterium]